jgi:hypothetical protein
MTVVEGPNAGTDFVPKADIADIQVSSEACSNDGREQKKERRWSVLTSVFS